MLYILRNLRVNVYRRREEKSAKQDHEEVQLQLIMNTGNSEVKNRIPCSDTWGPDLKEH